MTGKEILEEEFEKAGMRGGYNAQQVDAFLQKVAAYVDETNKQNSDLSYKIQILADKIEEYKADEENIREALLGAQKLGTSIVNEAKAKADAMTKEAKAVSEEMMAQAKAKIDALTRESKQKTSMELNAMKRECDLEQRNLEKMKQEVSNFKNFLLKQYKAQLQLLTTLPSVEERVERAPVEPKSYPAEPQVEYEKETTAQSRPAPVPPPVEDAVPEPEPVYVPEESVPIASAQTIASEVSGVDEDMEQDVKEQTKEFGASGMKAETDGVKQDTRRPQRQNYIEKFGELKFGGFGDK